MKEVKSKITKIPTAEEYLKRKFPILMAKSKAQTQWHQTKFYIPDLVYAFSYLIFFIARYVRFTFKKINKSSVREGNTP